MQVIFPVLPIAIKQFSFPFPVISRLISSLNITLSPYLRPSSPSFPLSAVPPSIRSSSPTFLSPPPFLSIPYSLPPSLFPSSLPSSLRIPSCLPRSPSLFPFSPTVDSIRGFAHAAGFAAARRCLQFLVSIASCLNLKRIDKDSEFVVSELNSPTVVEMIFVTLHRPLTPSRNSFNSKTDRNEPKRSNKIADVDEDY